MENDRVALGASGVAIIVSSTNTITDTTTWHHAVVTKTGATCKVYVDSADVTGSISNVTCGNGTGSNIGQDGGGSFADAILDECAIYATVLTPARVLAHYRAGLGANQPVPSATAKFVYLRKNK
jgi:Concanavalin A-like lectin/glucanases superfamily